MQQIIKDVLEKLTSKNYSSYIVGGYVRDFLLNKETKDIDICTLATPKQLEKIFNQKPNSFGALHFDLEEYHFTITPCREENEYLNHRPKKIVFNNDIRKDVLRRDFTMNMLYMDKEGVIYDFYNGREDIKNKIIRMPNSDFKLKEDPVRILRAIRFATILDFNLDKELVSSIKKNKEEIKKVSSYRVKEEMMLILQSKNYQKGLDLLKEFQLNDLLNIHYDKVIFTKNVLGMFAQLEFDNLPFTNEEKKHIVKIKELLKLGKLSNYVLYKYGIDDCIVLAEILGLKEEVKESYNNLPIHKRSDVEISFTEISCLLPNECLDKIKEIEAYIIKSILDKKLVNEKQEIKKFICKMR